MRRYTDKTGFTVNFTSIDVRNFIRAYVHVFPSRKLSLIPRLGYISYRNDGVVVDYDLPCDDADTPDVVAFIDKCRQHGLRE